MGYYIAAKTDAGLVKPTNQDAYCFKLAQTSVGMALMAVVCDGVGGLERGEMASTTVVKRFCDWFEQSLPRYIENNVSGGVVDLEPLCNVWSSLLHHANDSILAYGEAADSPLGTTFTGLVAIEGRYVAAHVGDCRLYEVTAERSSILTQDQTYVAQQVAAGRITEEEARRHPDRNVILQAVGAQPDLDPQVFTGTLRDDATYLLCCDGFRNKLEPEELHEAFQKNLFGSEADLADVLDSLVELLKERREKDNITALAFCHADPACGDGLEDATPTAVGKKNASQADDDDETPTMMGSSEDDTPTVVGRGAK